MLEQGLGKLEIRKETGCTIALDSVSLNLDEGEVFVVMGLSGSGKSTLLRLVNRLVDPTSGDVLVDGQSILGLQRNDLLNLRRHQVSMVFQRFALFPHKTASQNISYGLEVSGTKRQEAMEIADQWIETVGLQGFGDAYPHELSGGMQQRVGLARALAADPDILLMDEPFSALDPLIRREMQDELQILQDRLKKTILFVTHDPREAFKLGRRIAILQEGRLIQIGAPREILESPANDAVKAFIEDIPSL